jgi:ribosomal protein L7/L12
MSLSPAAVRVLLAERLIANGALAALWSPAGTSQSKPGPSQTTVRLESYNDRKIAVIVALRTLRPALGLKEAKDIVESAPVDLGTFDESKAKHYMRELSDAGARVSGLSDVNECSPDEIDLFGVFTHCQSMTTEGIDRAEKALEAAMQLAELLNDPDMRVQTSDAGNAISIAVVTHERQIFAVMFPTGGKVSKSVARMLERCARAITRIPGFSQATPFAQTEVARSIAAQAE